MPWPWRALTWPSDAVFWAITAVTREAIHHNSEVELSGLDGPTPE